MASVRSALVLSHYHAGEFRVFGIYSLYYLDTTTTTAAAFGGVKHDKHMTYDMSWWGTWRGENLIRKVTSPVFKVLTFNGIDQ